MPMSLSESLEMCTERCKSMDGTLTERLAALAADVSRLSPEFTVIVEEMVSRLKAAGAGENAPPVGAEMPPFVLPDEADRLVALDTLLQSGPVVVAFHRGHWCPYCRLNADVLARIEPDIQARGASLVIITPEVSEFNRRLKEEVGGAVCILTDFECGYALELNLAIRINSRKRDAMTSAGWDITPFHRSENWFLPIPATFIVGQDGLIKERFVDPDYRKRMDVEQLFRGLRA